MQRTYKQGAEKDEKIDLGLKIGSTAEVFWTDVKRKMEESILMYTESLIGEKVILKLAEKRIEEEKDKFKREVSQN